jgi:cytochrome c
MSHFSMTTAFRKTSFNKRALCGVAILLLTPQAMTARASEASRVAIGAQLYAQKCSLCHDNSQHMINDIGPALFGVVGRRVGSVEGFIYSPALRDADMRGDIWTTKSLDKFLTNPSHVRPGTGMPFIISDPKTRAGVVAYLKTLHSKP